MTALGGLFLVAHGLVHIAVWVSPQPPDAPFDARHSWILGDAVSLTRALAMICCVLFVMAGILVLAGAGVGATLAAAAAAISLLLVLVAFNPWLLAAIAVNLAIIVVVATS